MTRKHCDVKIFDPGKDHVIPVLPNQNFVVYLSGSNSKVHFESKFFELTHTDKNEKYTIFYFKQIKDLSEWGKLSRIYLGEILFSRVDENNFEHVGNLLVCSIKTTATLSTDLITVINPDQATIKVYPSSIIEVVVYDYHYSADWDVTIISGYNGIRFEKVASEKVDPCTFAWGNQPTSIFTAYPRSIMMEQSLPTIEHHYWFKVDRNYLHRLSQLPNGSYSAGKLLFDTKEDEIDFRILNVILNVRGSHNSTIEIQPPNKVKLLNPNIGRTPGRPKDMLLVHDIFLGKKEDCSLDSNHTFYAV